MNSNFYDLPEDIIFEIGKKVGWSEMIRLMYGIRKFVAFGLDEHAIFLKYDSPRNRPVRKLIEQYSKYPGFPDVHIHNFDLFVMSVNEISCVKISFYTYGYTYNKLKEVFLTRQRIAGRLEITRSRHRPFVHVPCSRTKVRHPDPDGDVFSEVLKTSGIRLYDYLRMWRGRKCDDRLIEDRHDVTELTGLVEPGCYAKKKFYVIDDVDYGGSYGEEINRRDRRDAKRRCDHLAKLKAMGIKLYRRHQGAHSMHGPTYRSAAFWNRPRDRDARGLIGTHHNRMFTYHYNDGSGYTYNDTTRSEKTRKRDYDKKRRDIRRKKDRKLKLDNLGI